MILSTLSSKGQITIPKRIREHLNLGGSDKIAFIPIGDGEVLMTTKPTPGRALFGLLKHRRAQKPAAVADMEKAIRMRRKARGSG